MTWDPQRLAALLPGVISLARAAGREIMQVYESDFAVTLKDDRSPLTAADLASQRVIVQGLQSLTPEVPVLGEESAPADIATRRQWPSLWLVDPLDGTREFVKRNGEFTVNIALVHEHAPVLGVLYVPVTNDCYSAALGLGAWHNDEHRGAQPLHASARCHDPPRVLASRSHRGRGVDGLLERLGPHDIVSVGSALKFARLAAGDADFYPRLSPTSEWDTAAGQIIVEEAGGRVTDLSGAPLRYNARDTLLNPDFVAWADDGRDWLSLIAPAATPASTAR
jgi:3'(2'), 5'-bisphosphate nucleotidase